MTKKIQDDNKLYSFLRPYVDHCVRRSYRRFEVHGIENIPKEGSLIFACNHSNALMDALVVLASSRHKKVFMARGDIFQKPAIAKILWFLRILPIFRIRDGFSSVKNNNAEIIDKAIDVVHDEVRFFLFPEGTHRAKHSLLKLSKGVFHIALGANDKFGEEKPIYIVPIGVEYSDYYRFRSNTLINYGKPINVTQFIEDCEEENEAIIMNKLKSHLYDRMSELFSFIPDDEYYTPIWEIVKMKNNKRGGSLYKKMQRNRKTIDKVLKYKEEHPEEAQKLFQKVEQFADQRIKEKISVYSIAKRRPLIHNILKFLATIVLFPFFVAATAVSLPTILITTILRLKLKDRAFLNTARFGVRFVMSPLIFIGGTIALFCTLDWWMALLGSGFIYISNNLFYDYSEMVRRWVSDFRWTFKRRLRKQFKSLNINKLF